MRVIRTPEQFAAEEQIYGRGLAHFELVTEASERARKIANRVAPLRDHGLSSFRFEAGGETFLEIARRRANDRAKWLEIYERARRIILAKIERRVGLTERLET